MSPEKLISDFILGGFLIAGVLAIANFIGPFMAGVIAALPVRVWATLLLGGVSGTEQFVLEMLRGVIPGSIGSLAFMTTLAKTTRRYGIVRSFVIACIICLVVTYVSLVAL
jgi:hypothetical protein